MLYVPAGLSADIIEASVKDTEKDEEEHTNIEDTSRDRLHKKFSKL